MRERLTAFIAGQTPALRSAFATTLACEIALATIMTLHLPNPAWALISVFVLATPTAGSSIQKGALRLVGTVVGAAIGIGLIEWFDQAPLGFSLALFGVCVAAAYGATSRRYPYAYLIGLVTIVIVAMESLTTPELASRIAFARAAEVCVGVATAVLVRLSLWPVRASATLRAEMATTLELSGPIIRADTRDDRGSAIVALLRSRQQQQALLATAGGEGDLTRAQEQRYAHAVTAVGAIVRHVLAVEAIATNASVPVLPGVSHALAEVAGDLAQALRRDGGRGGDGIARRLETLGARLHGTVGTVDAFAAALLPVLSALVEELWALARLIDYLGPGGSEAPPEVDAAALIAAPPMRGLRVDRPRLLHAVKVAVVVEAALWLWMIYHLPGGMQGMVSAVIIAQRTVGATLLKGRLRLFGAVAGGVLGILVASFALPGVSSLPVFCLLTAPVLFGSAWLNDGSPRWGYVGFQTGFAFILTLVAGGSPEPNTLAPVLRVCGVLIGVALASVVMHAAAPIDAWSESLRGLGGILASIGRSLRGADAPAGTAERTALREETMAYMTELLPGSARRGWSRRALDQLLALESCLAALVGQRPVVRVGGRAEAGLAEAAEHLATAAQRLAAEITVRRVSRGGRGEITAARAAVQRASDADVSASLDVVAETGRLRTAASLLAVIDGIVAARGAAPVAGESPADGV